MSLSDLPMRYEAEVMPNGKIEVPLPLAAGSLVTVYVMEHGKDDFNELLTASMSSTGFWNNPEDDEDWNNA